MLPACPAPTLRPATAQASIRARRSGRRYKSTYFLFDQRRCLEDRATLFKLLEEGKIKPVIMRTFPILEAAKANELLESGQAAGNIVLLAPELIAPAYDSQVCYERSCDR